MIVVGIIGLLAAIAIPNFVRARERAQQVECWNNIRQLEAAKAQYALESGLSNGATISPSSKLDEYLANLTVTYGCPGGGVYNNIDAVGSPTTCGKHGVPTA